VSAGSASKRILVTGGCGFLGSNLVRALHRQGHAVRVLDDLSRGHSHRLSDLEGSVEILQGDIRDASTVRRAAQGIHTLFHLAAVNGTRNFYEKPATVLEVGVKGTMNAIEAGVEAGVKEFFFASSSEVYQTPPRIPTDEAVSLVVPDPFNPRYSYGGSKLIGELLLIHLGKNFERAVIFRPHNVFGPDMGWEHVIPQLVVRIQQILSQQRGGRTGTIDLPIQGSGEQSRAFVHVDDFTDGLLLLFEKGRHLNIYNVGTSQMITVSELVEKIGQCLNIKIRVIPGTEAQGGTPRRCPDIRKISELGFKPSLSFDAGLRRVVKWYVNHAHPVDSSQGR